MTYCGAGCATPAAANGLGGGDRGDGDRECSESEDGLGEHG